MQFHNKQNSNSKPQSETKGSSHEAHWAYITGVPTVAKVTTNPQTHSNTVTKLLLQYRGLLTTAMTMKQCKIMKEREKNEEKQS